MSGTESYVRPASGWGYPSPMAPPISASQLRQDIYRLLDEVLETGEPLEIERAGRRLLVVPAPADLRVTSRARLAGLRPHPDAVAGDPADLVDVGWADAWRP